MNEQEPPRFSHEHEQRIRLLEARLHAQERTLRDHRTWIWAFVAVAVGLGVLDFFLLRG